MVLSKLFLIVVRILSMQIPLLFAGVVFDISLAVFAPKPVYFWCTVVCFGVAGIFCGLFCYGSVAEKASADYKENVARFTVLAIAAICALLFFAVAPLSGRDYKLAVQTFAITQLLTAFFLWKTKFHDEPG